MRKTNLIILGLGLCAVLPLRAQLFSPESVGGAAFGGLAGALIAGPHHAGAGAAIGAGAGFLLGAIAHEERPRPYYYGYYGTYYHYPGPPVYYSYNPYVYTPPGYYVNYNYANDPKPATAAPATPAPQPAAIEQAQPTYSAPATPMSSANALFGR